MYFTVKHVENKRVSGWVYEDGIVIDQFLGDTVDEVLHYMKTEYPESAEPRVIHLDLDTPSLQPESGFIDLDTQVREIIAETEELRYLGKLAPFWEGQHIGCIPPDKRKV